MIPMQLSEEEGNADLGIYRMAAVPREGESLYFREGLDGSRVWKVVYVTWRPDTPELPVLLTLERLDDRRTLS